MTVATHGSLSPGKELAERLQALGIGVVEGPIADISVDEGTGTVRVLLDDGRIVGASAAVVAPSYRGNFDAFVALGVATDAGPMGAGDVVEADEFGRTNVPGFYVAGNLSRPMGQVLQAASAGSFVGAAVHGDLVEEEGAAAVARARNAAEFESRYAAADVVWSGLPNEGLVAEAGDLAPGRALDVGCGEGADAIWLAERGWTVTGLDVSRSAIERAAAAAEERDADLEWVVSDLAATSFEADFDLVSVHYPSLPKTPDAGSIRALLQAVAPGGVLLVVGHAHVNEEFAHAHGSDLQDFVAIADIVDHLDARWAVELAEIRERERALGEGKVTHDEIWRIRRLR